MNEKHIYLSLLKVKNNTSINELIHEGLRYKEILELIRFILNKKYITETEDSVILSQHGEKMLKELATTYKKTDKKSWIKQDEKSLIKKMKKSDIFIPRSNELTFKIKFKE
ncbi:hypothetical protein [Ulvibacterium marinum]|uniref:ArnR1-like winged helix-turn-helix domain-containing protein n=1 Tax=Ulvibacterium marinum TaxID=2419782 RepID=A0A3B0CHP7_9FLAO|nr:hypothetical protein [Ulvibacterium marinum]RKN83236.1 hypothetical protein D7Z94_05235 [Ulvibacterium marinum]